MTTTTKTKTPVITPSMRVEKTLHAALSAVEKAGKEITHLAREGQKKIRAYERKTAVKPPRKA